MKRPPPSLRIAIVVAAVACLGLAMCAKSRATDPPQQPATQQGPATTDPATTDPAAPPATDPATPPANANDPAKPADPSKRKLPFPATKAPGKLY